MAAPMTPQKALAEAIRIAGSKYALAQLLNIKAQAVYAWEPKDAPVAPPLQALAIERVTGVSRHDLAPDFYPREKKAS